MQLCKTFDFITAEWLLLTVFLSDQYLFQADVISKSFMGFQSNEKFSILATKNLPSYSADGLKKNLSKPDEIKYFIIQ